MLDGSKSGRDYWVCGLEIRVKKINTDNGPSPKSSLAVYKGSCFVVLTFDPLTQILLSKSSPYVTATSLQDLPVPSSQVHGCCREVQQTKGWGGGGGGGALQGVMTLINTSWINMAYLTIKITMVNHNKSILEVPFVFQSLS